MAFTAAERDIRASPPERDTAFFFSGDTGQHRATTEIHADRGGYDGEAHKSRGISDRKLSGADPDKSLLSRNLHREHPGCEGCAGIEGWLSAGNRRSGTERYGTPWGPRNRLDDRRRDWRQTGTI